VKTYISGPISGRPNGNVEAFAHAQKYLERLGHLAVNPITLEHDHDQTWQSFMRVDLKALLECDAVYMLFDWSASHGARIEHAIAGILGMTVAYQTEPEASGVGRA
jgi:hypothetical protein